MSKYYTAFQYDAAYKPTALRNWQIPKYFCPRPRQRTGSTKIIANATGNLLPGVHRSEDSPWGNFIGTWAMPKKIDRKIAATLNGSADFKTKAHKCYLHYTAKPVQPQENGEDLEEKPEAEGKPKFEKEEIASVEAQEEECGKEQGSAEKLQEGGAPKEETTAKPICPIHGTVVNE